MSPPLVCGSAGHHLHCGAGRGHCGECVQEGSGGHAEELTAGVDKALQQRGHHGLGQCAAQADVLWRRYPR